MNDNQPVADQHSGAGALFAFFAFLIWGLSPIYWKALHGVGAFEIILHRILWSFAFLMPLVCLGRRWTEFKKAIKNVKLLFILLITAILVGGNFHPYLHLELYGRCARDVPDRGSGLK